MVGRFALPILLCVLSGCASLNISHNLNENVQISDRVKPIERDVLVTLSKIKKRIGRSEIEIVPYSSEIYSEEVNAVRSSMAFKNPIFDDVNSISSLRPKIEMVLTRTRYSGGCYMGGCIFWPSTDQTKYEIQFKVYDMDNKLVFQTSEILTGELRRTSLDYSLGFQPLRQVDEKGPALLIKRSLTKFQASDAFKKLFAVPKVWIEHNQ